MQININKKHFWALVSMMLVMVAVFVVAKTINKIDMDSKNKFGHNADDLNFKVTRHTEKIIGNSEEDNTKMDVSCDTNELAISCSVWSPTQDGDEDAWFCKLHLDQTACQFTYDTSGKNDDNEDVELHCYCIKGQK